MNVAGNKLARRSRWAPVENGLHDSSPASSVIPSAKDQLHCSSAGEREVTKGQQHSSKCAALLEEQRASQIAEFQENGCAPACPRVSSDSCSRALPISVCIDGLWHMAAFQAHSVGSLRHEDSHKKHD